MRQQLIIFAACLCSALVYASPIPENSNQKAIELVQIPLSDNKELDILQLANDDGKLSERNKRTIGILRDLFPELTKMNGENSIDVAALSEQLEETIRVARQAAAANSNSDNNNSNNAAENNQVQDQLPAESNSQPLDELTLDTADADGDDRNKRFLFGFGGGQAQAGGAAGGGSGNFLFDIIRRTADRAARAAGTVYRVVAGTETLDLNNKSNNNDSMMASANQLLSPSAISSTTQLTTRTSSENNLLLTTTITTPERPRNSIDRTARTINDGLFSGSVGNQQDDQRANAPVDASNDPANPPGPGGDGYTEGIPGPVTRLFVLANRGIANLIQDLILRIAQTSERVVNFKARLITSLI